MAELKTIRLGKLTPYYGWVTKEPELRTTQNENEVCDINVGVSTGVVGEDGKMINEFFRVTVWGGAAIYYSNLRKSTSIKVTCFMKTREFEKNDGTKGISYEAENFFIELQPDTILRLNREIEKRYSNNKSTQKQTISQGYVDPKTSLTVSQGYVESGDESDDYPFD